MKPFRERNPVTIGAVSILALLILLFGAFKAQSLPIIGGGTTYHADFTDLSGLKKGDDVRVAGVKVGKVESIDLTNGYVRIGFKIKGADLGDQTTASIRIKTLLGTKYLALDPQGTGKLSTHFDIPLTRTTTPFDVPQAFGDLSKTIKQVDTKQLAKSFDTLAEAFDNSPADIKAALTGLSRLSNTVSSRDEQLQHLLASADTVTNVLSDRDDEVRRLIDDGDLLLRVVEARRAQIHSLLISTQKLATQLIGLVRDNKANLDPALARLRTVTGILQKNQANLDKSLQVLAPFVRDFANTLGNGRWFDTIVYNLPPAELRFCQGSVQPPKEPKTCQAAP